MEPVVGGIRACVRESRRPVLQVGGRNHTAGGDGHQWAHGDTGEGLKHPLGGLGECGREFLELSLVEVVENLSEHREEGVAQVVAPKCVKIHDGMASFGTKQTRPLLDEGRRPSRTWLE